jgi:TonB family protein
MMLRNPALIAAIAVVLVATTTIDREVRSDTAPLPSPAPAKPLPRKSETAPESPKGIVMPVPATAAPVSKAGASTTDSIGPTAPSPSGPERPALVGRGGKLPARRPDPLNPQFRRWLEAVISSDSATVMRFHLEPLTATDSTGRVETTWNTGVASMSRVDAGWLRRFVRMISDGSQYDASGACVPRTTADVAEDQLVAGVRFDEPRSRPTVMVLVSQRCAQLRLMDQLAGSVALIHTPELFDLVREGLPQDDVVRRMPRPVAFRLPADEHRPPKVIMGSPPARDSLPKPDEFVYVEELPEAITKVPPIYPPEARAAGVDGTVIVQVLVDRDGLVKDTRMVKSIPMLDAAAEACVRQWVFKPALTLDRPVTTWVAVPIKFSLH